MADTSEPMEGLAAAEGEQVQYYDESGNPVYYEGQQYDPSQYEGQYDAEQASYDAQYAQYGQFDGEYVEHVEDPVYAQAGQQPDWDKFDDFEAEPVESTVLVSSAPADFDEFEQNFADFSVSAPSAEAMQYQATEEDEVPPPPPDDEEDFDNSPRLAAAVSMEAIGPESPSSLQSASPKLRRIASTTEGEAAGDDGVMFDQLASPEYSGPLNKQNAQQQWKKRIGVLKGTTLYLFPNQTSKAVVTIKLPGYKLTRKADNNFIIMKGTKAHTFSTNSEEEQRTWMRHIYLASILPDDNFLTAPIGTGASTGKKSSGVQRKGSLAKTAVANAAAAVGTIAGPKEIEVTVRRPNPSQPLGMDIRVNMVEGTTVKSVVAGGAVEASGQIREGDRLLKINQQRLQGMTTEQVIRVLKTTTGDIRLTILRS